MKLLSLTTQPFAGVSQRTTHFQPGLNVILGDNEAGKSTLLHALTQVLFKTSQLTPARLEVFGARYFPAGGGDCAEVALRFEAAGQHYQLRKRWGSGAMTQLMLPDGTLLRDDRRVTDQLAGLMGPNEATYTHVLMAAQASLTQTIAQLRGQPEALHSLSQLLRNALMSQGRVNVDELKETVEARIRELDGNWNVTQNQPRNGGGLEKRHINGNGAILNAWYTLMEARKALVTARQYEQEWERLMLEAGNCRNELDILSQFLREHAEALTDVRNREQLRLKEQQQAAHLDELLGIYSQWPSLKTAQQALTDRIIDYERFIVKLQAEMNTAQRVQQSKTLLDRYQQARTWQEKREVALLKRAEYVSVSAEESQHARRLQQEIETLRVQIAARRLKLQLVAQTGVTVQLAEGTQPAQELLLSAAQVFETEAAGKISLQIGPLSVTAFSGVGDTEGDLLTWKEKEKGLQDLLKVKGVRTIAELEAAAQHYQQATEGLRQAEAGLEAILQGTTFESLEAQARTIEELPPTRSLSVIQEELVGCQTDWQVAKAQVEANARQLAAFEARYGSMEKLIEQGHAERTKHLALREQLKALRMLPEGFTRSEDFIRHYEATQALYGQRQEELHQLLMERAQLEKSAPESSVEDLQQRLELAQMHFEKRHQEGKAYRKIRAELDELLAPLQEQTYEPLYRQTRRYLANLTGQKYADLTMEDALPVRIGTNGKALGQELLSQGTAGCLALALRLAMAEHYLAGQEGFLILDDPLVDLDPARQQAAATCLQQFAAQKQVIVLTCHPRHAQLLGGTLVYYQGLRPQTQLIPAT